MAVSTNLGLYLPTREDYISVKRDLSDNYEIIDESAGMLEKGIAIVVNGDTAPRAISSGDYLFIKNHSTLATGGYHATANIANGAAVTSSNTASDDKGVANTINGNIDSLSSKTAKSVSWSQSVSITPTNPLYKMGNVCFLSLRFNTTATVAAWELIGTIPADCRPSNIVFMNIIKGGSGYLQIGADGKIYSSVALTNNTEYYILNAVWFV